MSLDEADGRAAEEHGGARRLGDAVFPRLLGRAVSDQIGEAQVQEKAAVRSSNQLIRRHTTDAQEERVASIPYDARPCLPTPPLPGPTVAPSGIPRRSVARNDVIYQGKTYDVNTSTSFCSAELQARRAEEGALNLCSAARRGMPPKLTQPIAESSSDDTSARFPSKGSILPSFHTKGASPTADRLPSFTGPGMSQFLTQEAPSTSDRTNLVLASSQWARNGNQAAAVPVHNARNDGTTDRLNPKQFETPFGDKCFAQDVVSACSTTTRSTDTSSRYPSSARSMGWTHRAIGEDSSRPSSLLSARMNRSHMMLECTTSSSGGLSPCASETATSCVSGRAQPPPRELVNMLPSLPPCFRCPINQEIMTDPVICADGITYERENIAAWFKSGRSVSPATGKTLPSLQVITNAAMKEAIDSWNELKVASEQLHRDWESWARTEGARTNQKLLQRHRQVQGLRSLLNQCYRRINFLEGRSASAADANASSERSEGMNLWATASTDAVPIVISNPSFRGGRAPRSPREINNFLDCAGPTPRPRSSSATIRQETPSGRPLSRRARFLSRTGFCLSKATVGLPEHPPRLSA